MVGDRRTDVEAGKAARIHTALLGARAANVAEALGELRPDFLGTSLEDFQRFLLRRP